MEDRKNTEPKQVIIVRKDLNMECGKMSAQVSHASLGALFECGKRTQTSLVIDYEKDSALERWINHRFTKVVLYVKSEAKLIEIFEKARAFGLPSVLIEDAGFTVFNEPTKTCVGIGPVFPNELIGITDKLRVL